MKRIKRFLAWLFVVTIAFTSIFGNCYMAKASDGRQKRTYEENSYKVEYVIDSSWTGAYNASIKITNISDKIIENWQVLFETDNKITNIWNGNIVYNESGMYLIKNAQWNQDINVGETVSFGFTASADEIIFPDKVFVVSEKSIVEKDKYGTEFKVLSDWGAGYTAQFTIANVSESAIEDWIVEFDFDGAIDGIYNGQIVEHTGNHYVIKNAVYNQNIQAGGSITFGWNGNKGNLTAVPENIVLHNYITVEVDLTTDSDGDGFVDFVEALYGTDKDNVDSDGDGITDYQELFEVGTDPLKYDTDCDGISDYHEDADSDNLTNGYELGIGTNPTGRDTDFDDLADYEEISTYKTQPTVSDTDGDGAKDGWEVKNGYDPLVYNSSFVVTASYGEIGVATPVVARAKVKTTGADVTSLNIDKVSSYDNPFIVPSIAGYLGHAYDFTIDGSFEYAELTFEYDTSLGTISSEFQPRIYYFNEDNQTFEELANQKVENGKVTATTTHFSTYILLNKVAFDKVWENEIRVTSGNVTNMNIAFVVDLSGSMRGENLSTTKLAVNSFIDVLGENDKASIISFTSQATVRCGMTSDKATLKNAVSSMNAAGYTSIYSGINKALDVFKASQAEGYNMIIVFTDGWDDPATTYEAYYSELVNKASNEKLVIYTIGINTVDEDLLKKIAQGTGGSYYYASVIGELQNKVDTIKGEAVDITTDSNNDGISDYYTKLIMDGILVLSNGSDELKKSVYEQLMNTGVLSDDWDGDGLKNGEEIKVIYEKGKVYLKMLSHPFRVNSDGDGIDDYTEYVNGSEPMKYSYDRGAVDFLTGNYYYNYEGVASQLKDNAFLNGFNQYSSFVYGVWNKQELYRDLMIDYFSTYTTAETLENEQVVEMKKNWIDTFNQWLNNIKDIDVYKYSKDINILISYVNKIDDVDDFDSYFYKRVADLIVHMNEASEEATEMRFEVNGHNYVKKFLDDTEVREYVEVFDIGADKVGKAIQVVCYGVDIIDTITNISKIDANVSAFNANIDALEWMSNNGSNQEVRNAANDVRSRLAGEYINCIGAVFYDGIETIGDVALNALAKNHWYVAVVLAVRDSCNVVYGVSEDLRQEYRILCYHEMSNAYIKLMSNVKSKSSDYMYYYISGDDICTYQRCLVNLAQIRLLGEHEFYAFKKKDGWSGWILYNIFSGIVTDIEEYKEHVNTSLQNIKMRSDILKIILSSKIKYVIE